jgi:hypothetical protein
MNIILLCQNHKTLCLYVPMFLCGEETESNKEQSVQVSDTTEAS